MTAKQLREQAEAAKNTEKPVFKFGTARESFPVPIELDGENVELRCYVATRGQIKESRAFLDVVSRIQSKKTPGKGDEKKLFEGIDGIEKIMMERLSGNDAAVMERLNRRLDACTDEEANAFSAYINDCEAAYREGKNEKKPA